MYSKIEKSREKDESEIVGTWPDPNISNVLYRAKEDQEFISHTPAIIAPAKAVKRRMSQQPA